MSPSALERAGRAIAELDLSAENAQIEALQAEIARFNDAIGAAEQRRAEIRRLLAERRGPDAKAVAEALLDGRGAMQAAREGPSEEDLKAEVDSLRAAIGDLQGRTSAARLQIDEVRLSAYQRAAKCFGPAVDQITMGLREAAEHMLDGFGALTAINDATKGHTLARLAAEKALSGLYGRDALISYRRRVEVAPEITEMLRLLAAKGEALPVRVTESVPLP